MLCLVGIIVLLYICEVASDGQIMRGGCADVFLFVLRQSRSLAVRVLSRYPYTSAFYSGHPVKCPFRNGCEYLLEELLIKVTPSLKGDNFPGVQYRYMHAVKPFKK